MRKLQFAAFAAAFVLIPFALAACGGDDSSQDEDDITAAIDKAATSGDPTVCTELQTANFNQQTAGGPDPTKACVKDAADTAADSVDVSNVNVDGDAATADVAATGSILDGQTIEIALVKDADQWKLDKVDSFTDFNRDEFVAAFGKEVDQGGETPPAAVACLKQQIQSATDEQLQALVLSPDASGDKLFTPCFPGQ